MRELRQMIVEPLSKEFCKLGDMSTTSLDIPAMIRRAKEARSKFTEGVL
jgi:hypothetical protein